MVNLYLGKDVMLNNLTLYIYTVQMNVGIIMTKPPIITTAMCYIDITWC